ncbi:MAG: BON domain-containing protein [Anaerolineales bacterium]
MAKIHTPTISPGEFSRCDERDQSTENDVDSTPAQRSDAEIRENIYHAFWKDDVLRSLEYFEIDVLVKKGIAHLNGHILSTSSRGRVENAMRFIPGLIGVENNLVLDDSLTIDSATSLGSLEHTYACKFFTGASHGVVSLNGKVKNEGIKLLAEQCVAANPNVRGVINNIQVIGRKVEAQSQPFLQPAIGITIYFLDGISGVVQHVIVNPNNRRVTAMVVKGQFDAQNLKLGSTSPNEARQPDQLIVIPVNAIRFLTKSSGFLHIRSYESNRFMDFDSDAFIAPDLAWTPPYPYCPNDIFFSAKYKASNVLHVMPESQTFPFGTVVEEASIRDQFFANDSFGL